MKGRGIRDPLRVYSIRLNEKKVESVKETIAQREMTLSDLFQEFIDKEYRKIKKGL